MPLRIIIEENIPIPPISNGKNIAPTIYNSYPFAQMKIGDSIFSRLEKGLYSSARNYRLHTPDFQFTMRKENEGARLWRIL